MLTSVNTSEENIDAFDLTSKLLFIHILLITWVQFLNAMFPIKIITYGTFDGEL